MTSELQHDPAMLALALHRQHEALVVPHELHTLHARHAAGDIDDGALKESLNCFFAENHELAENFHEQISTACAGVQITTGFDATYGDADGSREITKNLDAKQLVAFLTHDTHLNAFHRVISRQLERGEPEANLRWLGQLDTTLAKLKSILAIVRYGELHHASEDEHPEIHARHDSHHERLHALHVHVRDQIREIEAAAAQTFAEQSTSEYVNPETLADNDSDGLIRMPQSYYPSRRSTPPALRASQQAANERNRGEAEVQPELPWGNDPNVIRLFAQQPTARTPAKLH